ncbi:DUF4156 domain-containing protein [Vibrio halioticoli]|uniref:DUF4156 domain-containing protein n=1 Tax=Vibrio halioticoli TaxID=71388 RepID=UPI0004147274|nr:DUF4156 domain-containing protein [Vibrio halioticoli]
MKFILVCLLSVVLTACTTPSNTLLDGAQQVQVRTNNAPLIQNCDWVGEVTGNEGHWYSYLFYGNDVLVRGAINDIKNNAYKIQANTVVLLSPHYFKTSATLIGTAYYCPQP